MILLDRAIRRITLGEEVTGSCSFYMHCVHGFIRNIELVFFLFDKLCCFQLNIYFYNYCLNPVLF